VEPLRQVLRFSYRPNTLGLCGRSEPGIYGLLEKDRWSRKDAERVRGFARDLKGMYAYLAAIGKSCGRGPFDQEVIDAYMVGWHGWEEHGREAAGYLRDGLLKFALAAKKDDVYSMPGGVPLTHCFHVLYFGGVAVEVPKLLEFADACKVSLGTVEGGTVAYNKLLPGLELGEGHVPLKSPWLEVGDGDSVFLHHGYVFRKSTPALERLYRRDLDCVLEWARRGQ
jgi:hypothetical protein